MNKNLLGLMAALLLASSHLVEAQQPKKIYRVGLLTLGFFAPGQIEAFRSGMRDLGYVEGRDLVTEIRFADGDPSRLSTLVAELLRLKVDLIVSNSTEVIQIVRETSKSMPLVMSTISDPLGSGLIASLAQPEGSYSL